MQLSSLISSTREANSQQLFFWKCLASESVIDTQILQISANYVKADYNNINADYDINKADYNKIDKNININLQH